MSGIIQAVLSVSSGFGVRQHDNEFIDRLVSRYSTTLFISLCVIVSSTSFVGEPIRCWCPAQFTEAHIDYANAQCLISATYHAPLQENLPDRPDPERHINYYVWVPLILLTQALLCSLPGFLWRSCYRGAGVNIPVLVSQGLKWEERKKASEFVTHHIYQFTEAYRTFSWPGSDSGSGAGSGTTWCCISKSSGNYLTFCYLFSKFFAFLVCFGQFVGLNWFLGFDFILFGYDTIQRYINKSPTWVSIERFPKVTMCEFSVRHMNKVHTWVLQCVLPVNLFNERIFLLIWFWLLACSVLTLTSLGKWAGKSLLWYSQIRHVRSKLFRCSPKPRDFETNVEEFVQGFLRRDAILLMRMMNLNSGTLIEEDVLMGLWRSFNSHKPPDCLGNEGDTREVYRYQGSARNELILNPKDLQNIRDDLRTAPDDLQNNPSDLQNNRDDLQNNRDDLPNNHDDLQTNPNDPSIRSGPSVEAYQSPRASNDGLRARDTTMKGSAGRRQSEEQVGMQEIVTVSNRTWPL